ncbi:MAG: tetratricopeptide repeat protein [Micrococcales bacterium]|nr:tetratricopeptide repeat protein [Micrococcales bacterium]
MTGTGAGEVGQRLHRRWWWLWGGWGLLLAGAVLAWVWASESAKAAVALWTSVPLAVVGVLLAAVPLVGRRKSDRPVAAEPVKVQMEPIKVQVEQVAPPEPALPLPLPVMVGNPPPRPPAFQPRTRYRDQIDAAWGDRGTVVLTQSQSAVVHGDGGVGKSQLAREYYESSDALVQVWVEASNTDGIITGYASAAQAMIARDDARAAELGVGSAETNQSILAEAFHRWLRTGTSWLVVLDDLDVDPEDLRRWCPSGPGRVLVTTRREDVGYETFFRPQGVVDLDVYTPDEALNYVDDRLTPHADKLPDGFLDAAPELVEALGCHPVALNQAAAVIIDEKLTTGAYLARFDDCTRTLSDLFSQPDIAYDRRTVATTWSIALERVATHSPHAAAMATLVSVAHPRSTPRCLFTTEAARRYLAQHANLVSSQPSDARTEPLEPRVLVADDLLSVDDAKAALRALENVAVIRTRPEPWDPIAVHALAQRAIGDLASGRSDAVVMLADAAMEVWPDKKRDFAVGPQLRAVAEHLYLSDRLALVGEDAHGILRRTGISLANGGLTAEAIAFRERLLQHLRRALGSDHRDSLTLRCDLADAQGEFGDVPGAVQSLEKAYSDARKALGENDALTLRIRGQLGRYRGNSGDPMGAARDLEAALSVASEMLGRDCPTTLSIRHNLGVYQGRSGDADGAVVTLLEALDGKRKQYGDSDPETLTTQSVLGFWRGWSGDPGSALIDLEQVLELRRKILGELHPQTLRSRHYLALWRGRSGDVDAAVSEFEEVLSSRRSALGNDHPDTLITWFWMAFWRGEAGDPKGAVEELESVLAARAEKLGEDNPATIITRHHLARWRGEAGDPVRAVAELDQVLVAQERVLAEGHPEILRTRYELARWRGEAGDPESAVRGLEEVLRDQERCLSKNHLDLTATRRTLAYWRGKRGD